MQSNIRREDNNLGIGGKLQRYIPAWRNIKGDYLIRRGMQAEWEGALPPPRQTQNRMRRKYTGVMNTEYVRQLQEELQEDIIVRVQAQECKWLSPTFLVPKKGGEWRKILDCRLLNKYIKKVKFQMEDIRTVVQLLEQDQWTVSVDITKAYSHVSVSPEMQPYLTFQYDTNYYQYRAMPFGVSSAPRIFTRIMKQTIKAVRERWQVAAVQYLDDLLFIHSDREWLQSHIGSIVSFLQSLGWTINNKKSRLSPQQEFVFLGMQWSTSAMTVRVEKEKNTSLRRMVNNWRRWIMRGKIVPVRLLARFIGKLSQTRLQHQRASIYLSRCNRLKTQTVLNKGWNGTVQLSPQILSELLWWRQQLRENRPALIRPPAPSHTLFTDASPQGWGGWLAANNNEETEWMVQGSWKPIDHRTSNFHEMMAVFLSLRHFYHERQLQQTQTIMIRSDNSSVVYDLQRMRAGRSLLLPLKLITNFCYQRNLHVIAAHIPGVENVAADHLSRLEKSGDYGIKQGVLDKALKTMGVTINIDLFANAQNHKCQRYVSVSKFVGAAERDAFSMEWGSFSPLIHPPIPLILRCLRKVEREGVRGVIIVPAWKGQTWNNLLQRMTKKKIDLGQSATILQAGRFMQRYGTQLPPGRLVIHLVDGTTRKDGHSGTALLQPLE
jgi:ribonuclease HI